MEAAPGFETEVGGGEASDSNRLSDSEATTRHLPTDTAERLFSRVEHTDNDCLEWTGNRNNCGYGQIRVAGKMTSTHRVAWILHFGPIPSHGVIMHGCDNPACINIDHLRLATRRGNVLDRQWKGRSVIPTHQRPAA